jgi:hypothetical protein
MKSKKEVRSLLEKSHLEIFKNQKDYEAVNFNCEDCGKYISKTIRSLCRNFNLCCQGCSRKRFYMENFGVPNVSCLQEVKKKKKETCKKNYGCENPSQSEIVKKKRDETMEKLYGSPNYFSSKNFKKDLEIFQEKAKQTNLKNWGFEFYQSSPNFKNNDQIKQKRENTNLKKYGVKSILQLERIRNVHFGRYKYEEVSFDSSWELALWIYARDHNEEIEREPCFFEYEFEGKTHRYFPDFRYKGKLIEIKGDQFVKEDGTWQNPFDHSQDEKYELKHQCALKNWVEIFQEKDILPFLNYCENHYGENFLKSLFAK